MKRYFWLALALAAHALPGCHQAEPPATSAALVENVLMAAPPLSAEPQQPDDLARAVTAASSDSVAAPLPPAAPPPPAGSAASVPARRLLVYRAEARVKTASMPRATASLNSLVQRSSGYVSASAETRADGEWRQETTIRVPPARFQSLLSGLAGLGTVEEKKLSTDDVTAEHADVAARLATKRAVERQYTALLGRAQRIKDVLDVEEKLAGVREEIEATESRLKTLNSAVAYSTITLTLYQPLPQPVPDVPVLSLGSRLIEAFYDGWQLLVSLTVGLIGLWPLALPLALGLWLWLRRRTRRASLAPAPLPTA